MATESTKVVYAALAGNVLVAVSKYVAAALSGSSAMLTEAVHSSADCVNQLLLLLGNSRRQTEPDQRHPFGYDGEMYFWTFVVAVMVLLAGGGVSLYEGIHELLNPHRIEAPVLSLSVLSLSAVFEGASLAFSFRTFREQVARHPGKHKPVSLWQFITRSKDPNLYESLLEDSAALIGIGLAAVGVLGNAFLKLLWMDAAASIAIGLLLIAVSYVIARETGSLVAGESVVSALRLDIVEALKKGGFDGRYNDLRTLHLGPETILVTLSVREQHEGDGTKLGELFGAIRRCITAVDERLRFVFFDLH